MHMEIFLISVSIKESQNLYNDKVKNVTIRWRLKPPVLFQHNVSLKRALNRLCGRNTSNRAYPAFPELLKTGHRINFGTWSVQLYHCHDLISCIFSSHRNEAIGSVGCSDVEGQIGVCDANCRLMAWRDPAIQVCLSIRTQRDSSAAA